MLKWKDRDPAQRRKWFRDRQRRISDAMLERKKWTPCMDCGGTFHPAAMEFDHRPGEKKVATIAQLTHSCRSLLEAEIAKCDLVCSNCHAVRTFERRRATWED